MPSEFFIRHTLDTAPVAARRSMQATVKHLGHLPGAVALMASSPQLLDGFLKLSGLFESTSLEPVARETLILTIATHNGCHLCVAMHTAKMEALGAEPEVIAALRDQRPIGDPRLEALRVFTLEVLTTAGDVGEAAMRAFLEAGYTTDNALEVVLGIGTYTLSTFANRMTAAPVDGPLSRYTWEPVPA